jgi:UDP-glucose 4-epimerase
MDESGLKRMTNTGMRRAVVTGPTGVLGTAVVRYLSEHGYYVYAVVRPGSKRRNLVPVNENIEIVECDMRDLSRLHTLIREKCYVFYHFGWSSTQDPKNRFNMYIQTDNIRYAIDAAAEAKQLGCEVFIGSGSQAEYGNTGGILTPDTPVHPESGYGMAKLCAGQMTRLMCRQNQIRHIWVRILSLYGKNESKVTLIYSAIQALLGGERLSMTKGDQIWDYLYADDAAEAFARMADRGRDGAVYVLGSGKTKTLREYVEIIRDDIDPAAEIGFGEKPYYRDQVMHLEADISDLERDLGWKPETRFEEGIREEISYYRERTGQ